MKRLALLGSSLLLAACSATPPAHWATGGTSLEIPSARWMRGDGSIDLAPDGRVFVNGEHELTIDRGGRVFDTDAQPIALLEPDGRLMGNDEALLGVVGSNHASLPGDAMAWLSVTDAGDVVVYDSDGERLSMGVWTGGCAATPRTHQVCTLVSHLLAMRLRGHYHTGGLSVGVGVGAGIGSRFR